MCPSCRRRPSSRYTPMFTTLFCDQGQSIIESETGLRKQLAQLPVHPSPLRQSSSSPPQPLRSDFSCQSYRSYHITASATTSAYLFSTVPGTTTTGVTEASLTGPVDLSSSICLCKPKTKRLFVPKRAIVTATVAAPTDLKQNPRSPRVQDEAVWAGLDPEWRNLCPSNMHGHICPGLMCCDKRPVCNNVRGRNPHVSNCEFEVLFGY